MSEVKRYSDLQVWETLHFTGSTNGWIRWEDYAAVLAASQWQPIETAPKDGLKVLVYDESYGLPQKAWFGKDRNDETYEGWLFGDGDDYSCGMYFTPINPTHWMPLPKPPAV